MPDTPNNHKPTIDERLEAITMHLEIVAGMQQANEKAIATLGQKVDSLTTGVAALTTDVAALTSNVDKMHDSISTLGRIAGLHQEELDQHDGEIESLTAIIERIEKRRRE